MSKPRTKLEDFNPRIATKEEIDRERIPSYKYIDMGKEQTSEELLIALTNQIDKTDDNYKCLGAGSIAHDIMPIIEEYANQQNEWISVDKQTPLTLSGEGWDGAISDYVVVETEEGDYYVARYNEGYMDGSEFKQWYDRDSYEVHRVVKWKSI